MQHLLRLDNMSEGAPVIGLPASMDSGKSTQYLSRAYTDAILKSGGIPVILPLVDSPEDIKPLAENLDGILLTGSACDVDPHHYGAVPDAHSGPFQPLRDKMDFALIQAALKQKTPVFAICFGMQSLNVFMGGSLIQDIPSSMDQHLQHECAKPGLRPSHPIKISQGSILEEISGGSQGTVNSSHHQAVDRVGQDLAVIARAPDGIIEAVAGKASGHWILGVQWHPEKSFTTDGLSRRLFEYFLARCGARRVTHERICS